jgi:hypothetical protein
MGPRFLINTGGTCLAHVDFQRVIRTKNMQFIFVISELSIVQTTEEAQ